MTIFLTLLTVFILGATVGLMIAALFMVNRGEPLPEIDADFLKVGGSE
ncbi:hypothetical protein [Cupriavidus taiwanensis]|nr:hypothetical protein [Cupriavidus taiwanensis]SPA44619.1 exported hypothetical protein [Cupriavidus taiwanensis]